MKKLITILLTITLIFALTISVMAAGFTSYVAQGGKNGWTYTADDCGWYTFTTKVGTKVINFFRGNLANIPVLTNDEINGPAPVAPGMTPHPKCACGACVEQCGEVCTCPPVEEGVNICPPCQNGQGNNHSNCFNGREWNENSAWYGFVCECACND